METAQTLFAIEQIRRLKARYFRYVDLMQLEPLLEVFTEDCSLLFDLDCPLSGIPRQLRMTGRLDVADYFRAAWHKEILWSAHQGWTPEIDVVSTTRAKGVWAMRDLVEMRDGQYEGYGHYHETYECLEDQWRIQTLHLTRTRVTNRSAA